MGKTNLPNRKSLRLKRYDYASEGCYFITICTKNKQPFFGSIENGKVILNDIGQIAEKFWIEIPSHFKNVELDDFVIMPNHIHGILIIHNKMVGTLQSEIRTLQCNVPTDNKYFSEISPKAETISTIIRSYKSICTKTINKEQTEIFFAWHTRFHDHIVRNEKALNAIRKYIFENPIKWILDRENDDGIYSKFNFKNVDEINDFNIKKYTK